jgi:hypothetical protein
MDNDFVTLSLDDWAMVKAQLLACNMNDDSYRLYFGTFAPDISERILETTNLRNDLIDHLKQKGRW